MLNSLAPCPVTPVFSLAKHTVMCLWETLDTEVGPNPLEALAQEKERWNLNVNFNKNWVFHLKSMQIFHLVQLAAAPEF